jgi:hypothetical protein
MGDPDRLQLMTRTTTALGRGPAKPVVSLDGAGQGRNIGAYSKAGT